MSKSRRDCRGNTREQRLQHENERLKKTINQLRKQLARVDLDRYASVRDIINKHYAEENAVQHAEKEAEILEDLKRIWLCNTCQTGHLEIILISKGNLLHYFRKCSECNNRTPLKPYNKTVQGIVKKT